MSSRLDSSAPKGSKITPLFALIRTFPCIPKEDATVRDKCLIPPSHSLSFSLRFRSVNCISGKVRFRVTCSLRCWLKNGLEWCARKANDITIWLRVPGASKGRRSRSVSSGVYVHGILCTMRSSKELRNTSTLPAIAADPIKGNKWRNGPAIK